MRFLLASIVLSFPIIAVAAPALSPAELVEQAPDAAWQNVSPDRLLIMKLGNGARVVIELAPEFAPVHVANVVRLAHAHAWDGGAIIRVQDNYVVQWRVKDETASLPADFVSHPPAEYERLLSGLDYGPLGFPDAYAPEAGIASGWPVGSDGTQIWPAHCYGAVGVGRDMPPDTGDGRELYVVNGEAPRQLDRNLAVIGRVVVGMEFLGALPRGNGPLGFYTDAHQNVLIQSVTLATDLPQAVQKRVQVMRTDSPSFRAYLAARAGRRDPFFVSPAQGVTLCNVPVPARENE